jgi:hypothetical protein
VALGTLAVAIFLGAMGIFAVAAALAVKASNKSAGNDDLHHSVQRRAK